MEKRILDGAAFGHGGDQWWAGDMSYMSDLLRHGQLGALNRWRAAGHALGRGHA